MINEYYYKNKNEENVKDENYYPNKVFNIDSFPIGVTISILLIDLLYIIVPQKFHIESCNDNNCDDCNCSENQVFIILILTLPCLVFYIAFAISNAVDEAKTIKKYNYLIYNWKTNPIKSIELSYEEDENNYEIGRLQTNKNDYKYYIWRNNYFKVKKLNNINYLNIYDKENGKLCGKDIYIFQKMRNALSMIYLYNMKKKI